MSENEAKIFVISKLYREAHHLAMIERQNAAVTNVAGRVTHELGGSHNISDIEREMCLHKVSLTLARRGVVYEHANHAARLAVSKRLEVSHAGEMTLRIPRINSNLNGERR